MAKIWGSRFSRLALPRNDRRLLLCVTPISSRMMGLANHFRKKGFVVVFWSAQLLHGLISNL